MAKFEIFIRETQLAYGLRHDCYFNKGTYLPIQMKITKSNSMLALQILFRYIVKSTLHVFL